MGGGEGVTPVDRIHQRAHELLLDAAAPLALGHRFGDVVVHHQHAAWRLDGGGDGDLVGLNDTGGAAAFVLPAVGVALAALQRSEEHTSELQSLMRISYA